MEVENEFREKCLGAINGKHIVIQAPRRSGSDYFNYKKTHSIVLLAVCNARYEFTLVDIGQAGRQSDGGVYKNSNLGCAIDQTLLNVTAPSNDMSSDGKYYPYVFVADDAFQMNEYMLKPYPRIDGDIEKRVFDYRFSSAHRIIENSFGILAARFRMFRRPINAQVETACSITKAFVTLHICLMKSQCIFGEYTYSPPGFLDQVNFGEERKGECRAETTGYTGMVPGMCSGKMAGVSLIEFIPANKKIEASPLYDDELLENSFLNKFNASDELLILHEEQLKTPNALDGNA